MEEQQSKPQSQLRIFFSSIVPSFVWLRKNDPLRLGGATAFFTTFALPPIIFILARIFGLILSPKTVGRGLIENLANNLGPEGAEQVRQVIRSIRGFSNSWLVIIPGFIFLLFVSTTLFIVIRNSLNQLWQVEKKKHGRFYILPRLKSFAVILLVGLLFFANLFLKSVETLGGNYLDNYTKNGEFYFRLIFSEISAAVIVSVFFVLLFRFLSDTRPSWRIALIGGVVTGLFFTAGKFVLRALLVDSNIGLLYGTAGSFVLVLLFVFYTSIIMYYGAAFIAVYAERSGSALHVPEAQSGEQEETEKKF